jgi:carbohydrate-binding DOMON domain-containing protein
VLELTVTLQDLPINGEENVIEQMIHVYIDRISEPSTTTVSSSSSASIFAIAPRHNVTLKENFPLNYILPFDPPLAIAESVSIR